MKILGSGLFILSLQFLGQFVKGQGDSFREKIDGTLLLESEAAFGFHQKSLQKFEFIAVPEIKYKINKKLRLVGIGRIYNEWTDKLDPGDDTAESSSESSRRLLLKDRTEIELRELYIDYWVANRIAIRLGKQQVVWGETDGIKLLDVVNPQYFREFVLDKFEDSRIPLWSLKAQFPLSKSIDGELIIIPDQTYHAVPNAEGVFFPKSAFPEPPSSVLVDFQPLRKPDRLIADSDVGLKLSAFKGGWDFSLNYLYHYFDFPVLRSTWEADRLSITPEYERQHLLGSSFNKTIDALVYRGEMVFTFNRSFLRENSLIESDQLQLAMGLDWLFGETILSGQLFLDRLTGTAEALNRSQSVWSMSLLASREFMNDNLKVQGLFFHDLSRGDGMFRPSADYLLTSSLIVRLGADIFYGSKRGLFGQFDIHDRIYLGFEFGL